MESGRDLVGPAIEPRKRGRPKGSTNKRAKDLTGFIAARYGASAAQQSAAICMVTPAELKAAGGSMAKAQVNKALELVKHVRQAQEGRNDWLRELVRQELRDLADELPEGLVKALPLAMKRISEAAAGFGLREAMAMLASERAALLPYTDQRQPLAVDVTQTGGQPSVVIMGAAPSIGSMGVEKAGVFEGVFEEVSQSKSHDDSEVVEIPGLLASPAAD